MGSDSANDQRVNASDDGLITPEVGGWARRKYHFLARYLDLFSTGMKNKWRQRHYIDLFAGAGLARLKSTGQIVKTSSLLAATTRSPFTHIHACERDPEQSGALRQRLSAHASEDSRLHVFVGDANQLIDDILADVPADDALAVVFVDPFGLHFDFATATKISDRRADLIVLLADNMDALRNWSRYYLDNPQSNLDLFMGEGGWRDRFANASSDRFAEEFREHYCTRLQSLGYAYFGWERVQNDTKHDIYTLLYASRHQRGLEFWQKARSVDEGGQRAFPWADA